MPVCSSLRPSSLGARFPLGKWHWHSCHLHHVCLMVWRRAVGGKTEFILDSRKILLTEKKLSWLPKHKWSVKNLRLWPGKPYNECLPSSKRRPCYCHEKYLLWLKTARGGAHLKGITASWAYGPIWIMPAHHTSFGTFRYMTTTTENPP